VGVGLGEDDPPAGSIHQEFDTSDTGGRGAVGSFDIVHVMALEEGVLFRMDGLTEVEARPAQAIPSWARNISTVGQSGGGAVISCGPDMIPFVDQHTTDRPPLAGRSGGDQDRHGYEIFIGTWAWISLFHFISFGFPGANCRVKMIRGTAYANTNGWGHVSSSVSVSLGRSPN
jgi:hypothetical protein